MELLETRLDGLKLFSPAVHGDERGFFVETYREETWSRHGIPTAFVQDNHSRSRRGTLRGLHWQLERPQGKLLRVLAGEIMDVAVDVRRASATFGRWVAVTLSAENFRQLYVPPGFAHGFCVTSEVAEMWTLSTMVRWPRMPARPPTVQ